MGFGLVSRARDGSIQVNLGDAEREVLQDVLGQLRDALVADTDDPLLQRLFPPAYPDDEEKEAGFRVLARDELLESRLRGIEEVESSLSAATLRTEQAEAWMRSFNALRLVLGTRLDVREDDDRGPIAGDDPDAPAWLLYELLSGLVDDLVGVLSPS
jgi:hypothetical protein